MKFGQREHLEEFRRGSLFTRPLAYYATLERNDRLRADRFEGTKSIVQPKDIRHLKITPPSGPEIVITPDQFRGPISFSHGPEIDCNVFCLFSITEPANNFCDPRNFAFGDSFVIILDTQEFLDRLGAAAIREGRGFDARLVTYYDPDTYSGDTGPFRKPDEFAYQKEFRVVIRPATAEPYRLEIGSIADITTPVHPLDTINALCDFGPDNARIAGIA
jgi:hypothetical protein